VPDILSVCTTRRSDVTNTTQNAGAFGRIAFDVTAEAGGSE
jgi:hypothetical protein